MVIASLVLLAPVVSFSQPTFPKETLIKREVNDTDMLRDRRQIISSIGGGCAASLFSGLVTKTNVANAEGTSKLSPSSQATVSPEVKARQTPARSEAKTIADKSTPTSSSSKLENPGDVKNCSDFESYREAKDWFDKYYDFYGDVAQLDKNKNLIPCESLPGAPSMKKKK